MKYAVIFLIFLLPAAALSGETDSLYTRVIGDTVEIRDIVRQIDCGTSFVFEAEIVGDTITVTETDTSSRWALCLCTYDLRISFTGLAAGEYRVDVYRRRVNRNDTVYYVGATSFSLGNAGGQTVTMNGVQSACDLTEGVAPPDPATPAAAALLVNYPNPFNPSTRIRYVIPEAGVVLITVHDALGREVALLARGYTTRGVHEIAFDGLNLPSGMYFCRLATKAGTISRKLLLVR